MFDSDRDTLVDLTSGASDFEAQVIRTVLAGTGFPAYAATTAAHYIPWDLGSTDPMCVQVRRCDLENAGRTLEAVRRDASGIDWSREDFGVPDPGEVAALGPGTPDWKPRGAGRLATWARFWFMAVFFCPYAGLACIAAFVIAGVKRLLGWTRS